MARPRKYFFFLDSEVCRIGPGIPLAKNQKVFVVGQGETEFIIHKIHPRKGGVTVTKVAA